MDFSPCGRLLAAATNDEELHLLDTESGRVIATVEAGEWTASVRFSPEGDLLAAACSYQGGGTVNVYEVGANGALSPLCEYPRSDTKTPESQFVDSLAHLTYAPDGRTLFLYETSRLAWERKDGWRGNLVAMDLDAGETCWVSPIDAAFTNDPRTLEELGEPAGFYTEIAVFSDLAAVGTPAGLVLLFDNATGALRRTVIAVIGRPVTSLQGIITRSGLWALSSDENGTLLSELPLRG